MNYLIMKI